MNDNNIQTFYILDLDRTLFNTIKNAELFIEVVHEYDPMVAEHLKHESDAYLATGESFSMHGFVSKALSKDKVVELEGTYLERAKQEALLNDGATELIAALRAKDGVAFGILTYGSPQGQYLKLRAGGLADVPHIITKEKYKGELIASWQQADGSFVIPTELRGQYQPIVNTIVLVDDRAVSFQLLPEHARGYLVLNKERTEQAQVPSTVKVVDNLREVMIAEGLGVVDKE